jgi:hypothetical protein
MVSLELIQALSTARRRMTPEAWLQLAEKLAGMASSPDAASLKKATAGLLSQDAAWLLSEAFRKNTGARWVEIAAAMIGSEFLPIMASGSTNWWHCFIRSAKDFICRKMQRGGFSNATTTNPRGVRLVIPVERFFKAARSECRE